MYFKYENHNYNFDRNRERRVVRVLKDFDFDTVFDVGANVGDWSFLVSKELGVRVFAFEIVPDTYDTLVKNCE